MGTLPENQAQEHNQEENRPGGEDLGAAAGARWTLTEARSAAPRPEGTLDLCVAAARFRPQPGAGRAGAPSAGSFLPPSSHKRSHGPARSQQAGLVADCELVVFSFGFCFHVRLPPPRPA